MRRCEPNLVSTQVTRAGLHALTSCDPDASRRLRRLREYERAVVGEKPVTALSSCGPGRAQNLPLSLRVGQARFIQGVRRRRARLVSADGRPRHNGNRRKESPVTAETRDRLVRISVLQEAALQSFQAFAPKPLLTSFSRHAAKPCVMTRSCCGPSSSTAPATRRRRTTSGSNCRAVVDSVAGSDGRNPIDDRCGPRKASQKSALKRLAYLGMPLLLLCFCATVVPCGMISGKTKRTRAHRGPTVRTRSASAETAQTEVVERKYKRLLLAWAPLGMGARAVETDNDDDDDACRRRRGETPTTLLARHCFVCM